MSHTYFRQFFVSYQHKDVSHGHASFLCYSQWIRHLAQFLQKMETPKKNHDQTAVSREEETNLHAFPSQEKHAQKHPATKHAERRAEKNPRGPPRPALQSHTTGIPSRRLVAPATAEGVTSVRLVELANNHAPNTRKPLRHPNECCGSYAGRRQQDKRAHAHGGGGAHRQVRAQ
ncbi:hypothetical protein NDU88_005327 [Pleurodeles waltl]|uniref:Uncharacterized protein n=1 Tax=Pleurodeles waltl TaxID=8319 RepID=A0AAV7SLI8_PLEWA|nr:hypothetical protein NDU88_005327 [Pleurodeles waltl]